MSFAHWLKVAALVSLPFAAAAQQKSHQADPTDANAPVPASAYESVFKNYRPATDEQESPDKTWRAANDEVEKLGGHAGHMKGEPTTTSASTSPTTPTPVQAPLMDHGKHH